MVRLKLGKDFPALDPISRTCDVAFDRSVDHAFNCRFGGDINERHKAIRDEIHAHGHGGGVVIAIEPLHILGENNARKPADVMVYNFMSDKTACFDVTVTNVVTLKRDFQAYGRRENLGKIAQKGYDIKIAKSKVPCEQR